MWRGVAACAWRRCVRVCTFDLRGAAVCAWRCCVRVAPLCARGAAVRAWHFFQEGGPIACVARPLLLAAMLFCVRECATLGPVPFVSLLLNLCLMLLGVLGV